MDRSELHAEMIKVSHRFQKINISSLFPLLSQGEFRILQTIYKYKEMNLGTGDIHVSILAELLNVTPPAVSRMLRGLEDKGFIKRNIDKNDRRNTYVYLTKEGEGVRNSSEETMFAVSNCIIERMGEDSVKVLIQLWSQMADIMAEEINNRMKG